MANSDMDAGEGSRRIRRAGILSQKIKTDEESSSTGKVGALRRQVDATGSGYQHGFSGKPGNDQGGFHIP